MLIINSNFKHSEYCSILFEYCSHFNLELVLMEYLTVCYLHFHLCSLHEPRKPQLKINAKQKLFHMYCASPNFWPISPSLPDRNSPGIRERIPHSSGIFISTASCPSMSWELEREHGCVCMSRWGGGQRLGATGWLWTGYTTIPLPKRCLKLPSCYKQLLYLPPIYLLKGLTTTSLLVTDRGHNMGWRAIFWLPFFLLGLCSNVTHTSGYWSARGFWLFVFIMQ